MSSATRKVAVLGNIGDRAGRLARLVVRVGRSLASNAHCAVALAVFTVATMSGPVHAQSAAAGATLWTTDLAGVGSKCSNCHLTPPICYATTPLTQFP